MKAVVKKKKKQKKKNRTKEKEKEKKKPMTERRADVNLATANKVDTLQRFKEHSSYATLVPIYKLQYSVCLQHIVFPNGHSSI